MSWASQIPKELTVKPLPLIVLTGLDIKHNAIHKEIWDHFSIRSNVKFRYKILDGDHEYPKCKPKARFYTLNACNIRPSRLVRVWIKTMLLR